MGVRLYAVPRNKLTREGLSVMAFVVVLILLLTGIYQVQRVMYRPPATAVRVNPAAAHKINGITADDLYDLSGSAASGGGDPFRLFDEQTDPANGIPGDPKTHPSPPAKIDCFYPAGKGLRMVVDLHDLYKLTDIYVFDRSFESDSVWIYSGSLQNWKLETSFATTSHTATWGWLHFPVKASSRFLMIRFNSYKTIITEMALYGDIQQRLPPAPEKKLEPLPPPTLREFAGTNTYDYVAPELLQPFSQVRLYQQLDYFDTDTVNAYPKNVLSLNKFNAAPARQLEAFADSLRRRGGSLWTSIRGLPVALEKKGFNEKDKPVSVPGMDTEDPLSYGRHARTLWNLAAVFGHTKVDTRLLAFNDKARKTGLGLIDRFENGNEEDAYWTKYFWTPMDYFAISSADYDGAEGRLGPGHGIFAADKKSRLMTSGMITFDTGRVRTLNFLCRELRKDRQFIWKAGVQYHYYCNAEKSNLRTPEKGISPEADHLREKMARVRAFHDRLLPGIPLILGENGYDRNQQSWQRTPLIPGLTTGQSQGILLIRSLFAAFMSGFDGYNQYMMRNAVNDENVPGPYATSGMVGGPATNTVYPAWYYWSAVVSRLGNFTPDAVITESGPVWIYRLSNRAAPGKKAWVLWSPTVDGTVIKNFKLIVPSFQDQHFSVFHLADNNPAGAVEPGMFNQGSVLLSVGESPVMLIEE